MPSSIDDILGSMRASVAPSAPAPPSHAWTEESEELPAPSRAPGVPPPLDKAHRVASAGADALDYRFRCGTLRIGDPEAATLCADCTMAFALNSSNWLAATAAPRCALERLARAIFDRHTAGVAFEQSTSGAEWWAQVRGGGHRHEGIEFHWDVDEHFCDLPGGGGVHVHPHLSTVTYLTHVGAPTLVLDAGSPKAATSTAVSAVYGPVRSGALSYPRLGKTIVFDGAKLHGAVPPRGVSAPNGSQRVTFLVNVWLGHRPHAVEPLPAGLAASMSRRWPADPSLPAFASDLQPPPKRHVASADLDAGTAAAAAGAAASADVANDGMHLLEVAFGRNDKVHALRVLLPPRPPAVSAATSAADSFRLLFEGDGSAELGPNTNGLKCDRSGKAPPAAVGGGVGKKLKKKREPEEAAAGGAGQAAAEGEPLPKKKKKVKKLLDSVTL